MKDIGLQNYIYLIPIWGPNLWRSHSHQEDHYVKKIQLHWAVKWIFKFTFHDSL